jgi:hypothetical protein
LTEDTVTGAHQVQPTMPVRLRTVVDPDLPARVRRRLTQLDPGARPADHLPWNKPPTDVRQAIRVTVGCLALLAANFALIAAIAVSGRDLDWKHARMGEVLWLLAGQVAVAVLAAAGCWLVGALRAVRRRAPWLRRRYAGRYVSAGELTELRDDAPMVGKLVAGAACQRDRLAGSRAWREAWLTGSIDEHDLDAALWHLTQTAMATAATMDAVNDAAGHPELSEHALAGQYDVAAATRALRAELTWMTTLADAAASIDAALAAADQHQRRLHRRDLVNEQLTRRRAALAAAHAAHRPSPGDPEAATAIAHYVTHELAPREARQVQRHAVPPETGRVDPVQPGPR